MIMKSKMHLFIFLAMILGIITGLLLNGMDNAEISGKILSVFDLFGKTTFIYALKMIVAPFIFFSILNAISSLSFAGELKSLGTTVNMFRTSTNVMDDCAGCVIVNRFDSRLNRDSF